jgi:hypothetical protein
MTAGFLKDEDKKAEKMKDVPMGRPSQPEEQAGMAILLLSDRSSCESLPSVWTMNLEPGPSSTSGLERD